MLIVVEGESASALHTGSDFYCLVDNGTRGVGGSGVDLFHGEAEHHMLKV